MSFVRLGLVRPNNLSNPQVPTLAFLGICALTIGLTGHAISSKREVFSVNINNRMEVVGGQSSVQSAVQSTDINTDAGSKTSNIRAEQSGQNIKQAPSAAENVIVPIQQAQPATAETYTREVELDKGQTFADMLVDADVPTDDADDASRAINSVFNHRLLKAGQEVSLTFEKRGDDESLNSFTFSPSPTKEITVVRQSDGTFSANVKNTPLERRRIAARGEIKSSLYEAGSRAGVPRPIMAALLRAWAHAVDFQRDVKPGDKFEILYEQPTAKDGTPIGQGTIIYASLFVNGRSMPLYRVTFSDGSVDYLDGRGYSVRRTLLRTPVDGARMTSGFGMRLHPLLGYSRMHKGVDFGAPIGTPIFAAGSGVVSEIGFKGGYGRYIKLRHNNTTETAYAHMSRFARDMKKGATVKQGEVIGFVGTSGRSTGPHLHFEVIVNGNQVNPLSVKMPTGRTLTGDLLNRFQKGQAGIQREFETLLKKRDEGNKSAAAKNSASSEIIANKTDATSSGVMLVSAK